MFSLIAIHVNTCFNEQKFSKMLEMFDMNERHDPEKLNSTDAIQNETLMED